MRKTREHIKRFLSAVRPATERDAEHIRLFLNNHRIKIAVSAETSDGDTRPSLTFAQFEAWYASSRPTVGDVIRSVRCGSICLVVREEWDAVIVGAMLSPDGKLSFGEQRFTDGQWTHSTEADIQALQKALSSHGYDWNGLYDRLDKRSVPTQPKFVRLMVMGHQVGVGIFRTILPDNTLAMYCVLMNGGRIRYQGDLNLGDADAFSFSDAYEAHRAIVQEALGEEGFIWHSKCCRIERNCARAKQGKSYYWINGYLDIKVSTEKSTSSDDIRFKRGNYFLNRAVAERVKFRMINLCKEEMASGDNC